MRGFCVHRLCKTPETASLPEIAIHHFIYFPTPLYTKTRCQAGFCVLYRFLWLRQGSPLGRAFLTVSYTPKAPIRQMPDGGLWLFILEKEEDSLIILRCGSS